MSGPVDAAPGREPLLHAMASRRGEDIFVKMSPIASRIFAGHRQGRSFAEIAEEISAILGQTVSAADVEIGFRHIEARMAEISDRQSMRRDGYWCRFPLLPADWVLRWTGALQHLLHPACVVVVATLLATEAMVFGPRLTAHAVAPVGLDLVAGFALFLLSTLFHELGHASACRRFGGRPGAIGFTMYLFIPSLFSDANDSWRLARGPRIVVDIAGIYFHLIAWGVWSLAWTSTGQPAFAVVSVLILMAVLVNLNPFLRFDGYWLLSDLVDVPNLSEVPGRLARQLISRLCAKPVAPLPWTWPVRAALMVYSAGWVVFMAWCLWNLARWSFLTAAGLIDAGLGATAAFPAFDALPSWSDLLIGLTVVFALVGLTRTSLAALRLAMSRRRWKA